MSEIITPSWPPELVSDDGASNLLYGAISTNSKASFDIWGHIHNLNNLAIQGFPPDFGADRNIGAHSHENDREMIFPLVGGLLLIIAIDNDWVHVPLEGELEFEDLTKNKGWRIIEDVGCGLKLLIGNHQITPLEVPPGWKHQSEPKTSDECWYLSVKMRELGC